eukprot:3300109-Amphidinium_carterae.1
MTPRPSFHEMPCFTVVGDLLRKRVFLEHEVPAFGAAELMLLQPTKTCYLNFAALAKSFAEAFP